MKYTDRELDRLLEKLIASTRSPRGKFSAAASYQIFIIGKTKCERYKKRNAIIRV